MWRMKASVLTRKARTAPGSSCPVGASPALEVAVLGLGRGECGEVVAADDGRRAGVEPLAVDLVRPPEGVALLERARCLPGQQPVAVAARGGVVAGVEAGGTVVTAVTATSSGQGR